MLFMMSETREYKKKVADSAMQKNLRDDFPVFKREMNGKPLVYLDSAASAQKPRVVIEAMSEVMENHYANIHRGLYDFSQTTTRLYEQARQTIASFVNAPSSECLVFTKNATEAINLVAHSWAGANMSQGDVILLTEMEHHANIVPWQILADQKGLEIRTIPVNDTGELLIEDLESVLDERVKIVSFVYISNALGTINPAGDMIKRIRKISPDIKILIDGTQAVVHKTVDFSGIDCDFLVFTGHKLYGPTGVGCLVAKQDILADMPPFLGGGDMIEDVSFEGSHFKAPPARFEAGTPPIVEAIGLARAVEYLQGIGMQEIEQKEADLLNYATPEIKQIDGIEITGQAKEKAAILSFTHESCHSSDFGMILDQMGVAIRTGHHCCMPLMKKFGLDSTARASIGIYNTYEDIDRFIQAVRKAVKMLG